MNKKGFVFLEVLIAIAVIAILGGGGWYVSHLKNEQSISREGINTEQQARQIVQQTNGQIQQEQNILNQSKSSNTSTQSFPTTSLSMASSSMPAPVWIKITTTTINPINVMKFNYKFESPSGSQGVFSVSVDNQIVDILDERVATSGQENNIFIGNLSPGVHTFAFRLDSYTQVTSTLELSDFQLGYLRSEVVSTTPR